MRAAPPRRKHLPRKLPIALLLAILSGGEIGAEAAATVDKHAVTMNMRDADIRALIQWIAEQTRKQIVIDPRVQGRVSIFADQPISITQAYQVFLAALQTQGYATSETEGVLKIYPIPLAKGGPRELVDSPAELVASGQVMHVVSLQNVAAASAGDLIKPLLSPTGYIAPLADSNSLLIADDSSMVSQVVELARRLDSGGSLDIDIVRLQHANARDIAQVLTPLTKARDGTPATGTPLSISAEERSNTVLLAGDPAGRQRAIQLIRQLDQPIATTAFTRVVFLNYLSADELIPVLKSTATNTQKDAKEQAVQQATVSVEASKSANALVLTGPSDLLDAMQDTIAKLDVRRSQVLVQAVIVEVSQDLANSLGVQWNTDFASDGTQAATNFGLAPSAAAVAIAGNNPLGLLGSGLTLGYLKNGSLRAIVTALASTTDANLLSTPSVMTLDNQQAEIIVGSNIPLISGQLANDASGTQNPFTTFERKDIGVKLKLTPQINRNKAITLDVLQEVETISNDATATNSSDIITNKRSINTKVIVNNNDVLVLGGLISDEDQKQVDKVPVLGDLPMVGALFRSTTTKTVKRQLMVFINPVIVDSAETAEAITRTQYDNARSQQKNPVKNTIENSAIKTLPEFETITPNHSVEPTSPH